jgi:hypothetical protein
VLRTDKKAMEKVIFAAAAEPRSPLGDYAMVRLPLLTGGEAQGPNKVKASWVWSNEQRKEKLAGGHRRVSVKSKLEQNWTQAPREKPE